MSGGVRSAAGVQYNVPADASTTDQNAAYKVPADNTTGLSLIHSDRGAELHQAVVASITTASSDPDLVADDILAGYVVEIRSDDHHLGRNVLAERH